MPALAAHLRAGAARAFAWGEHDCCVFACGWVKARRGVDPAARWRGRYRTAGGAARHLRRGGGLDALAGRAMAEAGLGVTTRPVPGDVGLVKTAQGLALAIRTPTGWACAGPAGITVAPFAMLAAWSV